MRALQLHHSVGNFSAWHLIGKPTKHIIITTLMNTGYVVNLILIVIA